MLVLLAMAALAQDRARVAVLDFEADGVSWEDARIATQGVCDALLDRGLLLPLSGDEIGQVLLRGHDDDLRRARDLLADGRLQLDRGHTPEALDELAQAVDLHVECGSDIARRSEMADAYGWAGAADRWLIRLHFGNAFPTRPPPCYLFRGTHSDPTSRLSSKGGRRTTSFPAAEARVS